MIRTRVAASLLVAGLAVSCSTEPSSGVGGAVGAESSATIPPMGTIIPSARDATEERDKAADAYLHFWAVAYALDAYPITEWECRLGAVATDPLFPQLLHALRTQHASGVREYGRVRPQPVTVEVHGDLATIVDCQDASGAGEAYADSGMPKTVGRARTPIVASLRRGADGQWKVSEAKELDTTC